MLQEPRCYKTTFVDHKQVPRDIGQDSFTQVTLARHLLVGTEMAVKVMPNIEQNSAVLSELDMIMAMDH